MSVTTATHLNFRGQAREALEFYQSVFGGHLVAVTHAQGYGTTDPTEADLISWGQVRSEAGFHVMAYDVPTTKAYEPGIEPVFVSVRARTRTNCAATGTPWPRTPRSRPRWSPPGGPRCTGCSPTASASPGCWTSPRSGGGARRETVSRRRGVPRDHVALTGELREPFKLK